MIRGWGGANAAALGLPAGRLAEAFQVVDTRESVAAQGDRADEAFDGSAAGECSLTSQGGDVVRGGDVATHEVRRSACGDTTDTHQVESGKTSAARVRRHRDGLIPRAPAGPELIAATAGLAATGGLQG